MIPINKPIKSALKFNLEKITVNIPVVIINKTSKQQKIYVTTFTMKLPSFIIRNVIIALPIEKRITPTVISKLNSAIRINETKKELHQ